MLGCRIAGLYGNTWTFQVAQLVKDSSANTRDARDAGWIPGSGRSPGGENGNPLQYSCLENFMDRRAWEVTVHGSQRVGHNWAWTHTHTHILALCLTVWRTAKLFFTAIIPFYNTSPIPTNTCYCPSFYSNPSECGTVSLRFWFVLPWWLMMLIIFLWCVVCLLCDGCVCAYWSYVYFPWRNSHSNPFPFLNWVEILFLSGKNSFYLRSPLSDT